MGLGIGKITTVGVGLLALGQSPAYARPWPSSRESSPLTPDNQDQAPWHISQTSTTLYSGNRHLDVDVRIPDVTGKAEQELPTVIYSHGVLSNAQENKPLLDYIAGKGYRVIASTSPTPSSTSDLANKADDMVFLQNYFGADSKNTIMIGYSLGSLAALIAGNRQQAAQIIAIAPPAHELFPAREDISLPTSSKVPTTVIVGDVDSVAPKAYSIPMAKEIGAELHVIPEATHLGFVTAGLMAPAILDKGLCHHFQTHYPEDYRCPPVPKQTLSFGEQQKKVQEILDGILKKMTTP